MNYVFISIAAVYVLAILAQLRGYVTSVHNMNADVEKIDRDASLVTPR